ncbi:MAG: hypothetical protein R3208_06830 [Ketobacteraceae bacterium]|nr:hypothetical protein [Ketobacteraceae bacterium]
MPVPQRDAPKFAWKVVLDFRETDISPAHIEARIDRWARILRKDILKTISVNQRLVYRTGDIIFTKTIASMAAELGGKVTISESDASHHYGHQLSA